MAGCWLRRAAKYGIAVSFLFILSAFTVQSAAIHVEEQGLRELLQQTIETEGIPGITAVIVEGDEVLSVSAGLRDRKANLPTGNDTLYRTASLSKAFTGYALLLLETEGKVSLTDPIQHYIPWLTLRYKGKAVNMDAVTVEMFLHHTSGITNDKHWRYLADGKTPSEAMERTVRNLSGRSLAFAPGERYEYGSMNYSVLGMVIEAASGKPYPVYMQEAVFTPFGLHNTTLDYQAAVRTGDMAQGYVQSFLQPVNAYSKPLDGNMPGCEIITNGEDMARWMQIQLGVISISEQADALIQASHIGNRQVPAIDYTHYAAGWAVTPDGRYVQHNGDLPGFSAKLLLRPKQHMGICLLTNGTSLSAYAESKLMMQILQKFYQVDLALYTGLDIVQLDCMLTWIFAVVLLLTACFVLLWQRKKRAIKTQYARWNRKGYTDYAVLLDEDRLHPLQVLLLVFILLMSLLPEIAPFILHVRMLWMPYSFIGCLVVFPLCGTALVLYLYQVMRFRLRQKR